MITLTAKLAVLNRGLEISWHDPLFVPTRLFLCSSVSDGAYDRGPRDLAALDIGCLPNLAFNRAPAAGSRNEWKTRMDAIPDDSELADTRTSKPDPAVSNT